MAGGWAAGRAAETLLTGEGATGHLDTMTRQDAIRQLRKLLGSSLSYRVGETISSPEKRAQAKSGWDAK